MGYATIGTLAWLLRNDEYSFPNLTANSSKALAEPPITPLRMPLPFRHHFGIYLPRSQAVPMWVDLPGGCFG